MAERAMSTCRSCMTSSRTSTASTTIPACGIPSASPPGCYGAADEALASITILDGLIGHPVAGSGYTS